MGQFMTRANLNNHKDSKGNTQRKLGYKKMLKSEIRKTQCSYEISSNEQCIAYQFTSNIIKIQNFKRQLSLKQVQIKESGGKVDESIISCLGYFKNNRLMFCVINNLIIRIYRSDHYYKQIYTIYSQNGYINDIKIINQSQILTCCQDGQILVTDFLKKIPLLQIPKSSKCSISQIEFDSQNEVIISYSFDMFINFYKMNGENIINQKDSNFYYQIQLTENSKQLIGRSHMQLVLWQIDYEKRQLIMLKEFKNQRIIFRISNYQSGIILLDSKDLIILNMNDFKIIYKQRHLVKNIIYDRNSKLTNSDNYLVITCFGFIKIIQRIQ